MAERAGEAGSRFAPESIADEHLVVSYLLHRISSLSKEALADLAELGRDVANCESWEQFGEIAQTMREILFPDSVLGDVQRSGPESKVTERLRRHSEFVGDKIKEHRESAHMTQTQLAEAAGLPQSHISRLENGQHSPSNKTVAKIAGALKVSIRDLDPMED